MKKLILVCSILMFSTCLHAECPTADLSGDCVVGLADLAIMANEWMTEGVFTYSALRRDDIAVQEAEMSTASIDASDGNEFMPGTYFIYKTDEGRFGKFMVEIYETAKSHRLTIRWVTYNANGTVYSHGTGLVIRSSWSCDLDEGLEISGDWRWHGVTSTTRHLDPTNGAKFKLMHRAIVPEGIVWVYVDEPVVSGGISGYKGYMSKYETTNGQYAEYLNSALADSLITVYGGVVYAAGDSSHSKPYFDTYAATSYSQITYSGGTFSVRTRNNYDMSNHPVVEVSWYGAKAFADYYGYRLPTQWEWQAVADHYGEFIYGCGITIDHTMANYDLDNPLGLSSYPYTTPVDYYETDDRPGPYGYGICDLAGNVWEWTDSWGAVNQNRRVIRGGNWIGPAFNCELTVRNELTPSQRSDNVGFRLLLDL